MEILFNILLLFLVVVQIPAPGWAELHVVVSLSKILNPKLLLMCSWHLAWRLPSVRPCNELVTCPGCTLPSPRDSWDRLQQIPPWPSRIMKHASKITGTTQSSLSDLHTQAVRCKATSIVHDPSHPLHNSFQLLPSGRRYRVPLARTNLVRNSFFPSAINIINNAL